MEEREDIGLKATSLTDGNIEKNIVVTKPRNKVAKIGAGVWRVVRKMSWGIELTGCIQIVWAIGRMIVGNLTDIRAFGKKYQLGFKRGKRINRAFTKL